MPYRYSFTPEIVRLLGVIERARTSVDLLVLPPGIADNLRMRARVRSTHFSTRIEGNRLTLNEAEQVLLEGKDYPGRERDTLEVQHYFQALEQVEGWVDQKVAVSEDRIRKLHALIYSGKRSKPTPYRDGQNVIRERSGGIVYMPPEASDVPVLMQELVTWIKQAEADLPAPVIAGITHYQFVTIHPFFDGNGRTARALATWLLYRGSYDLGRFYALEEFYDRDLPGYYQALVTDPHHNYYDGRNTADITSWLQYFLTGMADVFESIAREVAAHSSLEQNASDISALQQLTRRQRIVLGLFSQKDEITARDVAQALGLSERQVRNLLAEWSSAGWLLVSDPARKTRRYRLSAIYRQYIGKITAIE